MAKGEVAISHVNQKLEDDLKAETMIGVDEEEVGEAVEEVLGMKDKGLMAVEVR